MIQEVIDAIVHEVDDNDSLKACALVASTFRGASQRILLHSLTLKGGRAHDRHTRDPTNHQAVYTLLESSPHIIPYIRDLKIQFPSAPTPPADVKNLKRVLTKLTNVRRCILNGIYISKNHQGTGWGDLIQALSSVLIDFISRQSLRELHVHYIMIPLAVLLRLLTSAPTVSLYFTFIHEPRKRPSKISASPLSRAGRPLLSSLDSLILDDGSDDLCELLSRPQFAAHTAHLRRLAVMLYGKHNVALISTVTHTIQYLRINCHGVYPHVPYLQQLLTELSFPLHTTGSSDAVDPPSAIPPIPSLRCLELVMAFEDRNAPYFLGTLAQVLATCWAVEEVLITYRHSLYSPPDDSYEALLLNVEQLLLSCPSLPRIRWRAQFKGKRYREVAQCISQKMAKIDAEGKLVVESYSESDLHGKGLPYAP